MRAPSSLVSILYPSPCGELLLGATDRALICCDWYVPWLAEGRPRRLGDLLQLGSQLGDTSPLLERAVSQLDAYFLGLRSCFDLPLAQAGTTFQQAVWDGLQRLPYGQTRSYGWMAEELGRPRACRAVGSAAGANRLAIFVPCHRLVARQGGFSGYRGGREAKEYLLDLERRYSPAGKGA